MIPNQRHLFDIPDHLVYLNCAYLSPLLRSAAEAGKDGIDRKLHPWTLVRRDFFDTLEEARALFAQLINAETDEVAIVPASSYGAAVAGANLPLARGQKVVVIEGEHFSNVYQWMSRARESGAQFVTVPRPVKGNWTRHLLDRIDRQTAIVATPNCHWHDGLMIDLEAVAAAAHSVGARMVVDATQSIGALPLDVKKLKPAFLLCSAYKWLLGPYGLAFLYVDPAHHNGRPLEHHPFNRAGAADVQSSVTYVEEFMVGARRYDFGQRSNFIQLPMINVALAQILEWGVANIQETLTQIVSRINRGAANLGLTAPSEGEGAGHLTGIRFAEGIPAGLQDALAKAEVHVSFRRETVRISPYLYNSLTDADRLLEVLAASLQPIRS